MAFGIGLPRGGGWTLIERITHPELAAPWISSWQLGLDLVAFGVRRRRRDAAAVELLNIWRGVSPPAVIAVTLMLGGVQLA